MTKRNIVALCGLLAASGLQASQIPNGPAMKEALEKVGQGVNPFAPMAQTATQSIAPQGLRTQASNATYAGWENLKGKSGYLWNRGGEVLGSAGEKIAQGWDWSKNQPGLGRLTQGLGSLGTTAASYAAHPYLAQSIANRLPSSASFVSDYPTTTNVAAVAGALGAGYGLKRLYNRYMQPAQIPLDTQISQLLAQEKLLDMQLNGEAKYSQTGYFFGYRGGLYDQLKNTSSNRAAPMIKEKIEIVENNLEAVKAQIKQAFAAKVNEIVAQTPGSTSQKMSKLQEILTTVTDPEFGTLTSSSLMTKKFGMQLPAYYGDIRFIQSLENKLASLKSQPQTAMNANETLDQKMQRIAAYKQQIENELFNKYANLPKEELTIADNKFIDYANSIVNDLEIQLGKLRNQQQKELRAQQQNTGYFGWFRRR